MKFCTRIINKNRGVRKCNSAEIMWSIDVVSSNYSFNSVSNKSDLFCKMFPDSKIAENFSCEDLNVAMLSVLVWLLISYVATRCYHSEFMGKASAKEVLNPLVHAYQVSVKTSCSRFLLIAQT